MGEVNAINASFATPGAHAVRMAYEQGLVNTREEYLEKFGDPALAGIDLLDKGTPCGCVVTQYGTEWFLTFNTCPRHKYA